MHHPTSGLLRRMIDEPAGVADAARDHVAGCSSCLDSLATIQDDAARVGAALDVPASTEVDVDAAWGRLTASLSGARRKEPVRFRPARRHPALRRPAVAAVAVVAVLAAASTAAANDWLPIFRTEQIATVGLSTADLVAVPDLSAYGELDVTQEVDVRSVPDAAAAAAATGLEVPEVTGLPRGVDGDPVHQVAEEVSATFTFSSARAAEAARDAGEELPAPPPGLDGSRVRLFAGPGVAAIWTQQTGMPSLVVGRAVAPKAESSGVPFDTIRDYLLALPGMPDEVAAQLRTFTEEGTTLPLPVPEEQITTSTAQIDGRKATVLAARDRTFAAVVWVRDGIMSVVAGPLDADEVLTVARGLR